jgi:hypothetical protein
LADSAVCAIETEGMTKCNFHANVTVATWLVSAVLQRFEASSPTYDWRAHAGRRIDQFLLSVRPSAPRWNGRAIAAPVP